MKVLLTCVTDEFKREMDYLLKTGKRKGGFDRTIGKMVNDIDPDFAEQHNEILSIERGAGLWLWKAYYINRVLEELEQGDFLFYCDASAYFLRSCDPLINIMNEKQIDVMCFDLPLTEKKWTSKSCIDILDCSKKGILDTPQRTASYMILRKSLFSQSIAKEFLSRCCDKQLLEGGTLGNECIAHRNDQSIWSLITKKHGIDSFRDPSQYGLFTNEYIKYELTRSNYATAVYKNQSKYKYKTIIYLYRRSKHYYLRHRVKPLLVFRVLELFARYLTVDPN